MELSAPGKNSVKIKTKNTSITIDPEKDGEQDVIIFTQNKNTQGENAKLIIDGPGEYEVGGVSIKGIRDEQEMIFSIFDDSNRIMVFPSSIASHIKESDECDAVVVHVNTDSVDKLEQLSSDVTIVYGNEEITEKIPDIKKLPKVNLKKKEEIKGSVIFLG